MGSNKKEIMLENKELQLEMRDFYDRLKTYQLTLIFCSALQSSITMATSNKSQVTHQERNLFACVELETGKSSAQTSGTKMFYSFGRYERCWFEFPNKCSLTFTHGCLV